MKVEVIKHCPLLASFFPIMISLTNFPQKACDPGLSIGLGLVGRDGLKRSIRPAIYDLIAQSSS